MTNKKISCHAISDEFFHVFADGKANITLAEYLDNSYCDEISEIDLKKNTYELLSHVAGKYVTPETDGKATSLIKYAKDNVVHPDDVAIYDDLMNLDNIVQKLKDAEMPNFRFAHFRYKLLNGEYRWFEQAIITGKENGLKDGIIRVYIYDINNAKMRELGHMSNDKYVIDNQTNELTGLLKTKYFIRKGEKFAAFRKNIKWAILSIDIEHFKLFDEWYGREKGDLLLKSIGGVVDKLSKKYRGFAGYLGQDDFALLLPYSEKTNKAVYEAIRNEINKFNDSIGFMPAIGVCLLKDAATFVDALDKASIAAYHAKQDIKIKINKYDPQEHKDMENEYKVLTDSLSAIKNGEMTFYLQPQCHLSTGKVVGAEALARWITPNGDVIWPGSFIPVLEKYGFVADLDMYIWELVFKWIQRITEQGLKTVPISINVSRVDIFSIDVRQKFNELAEKYNVPKDLIKIEITESAYAENSEYIGKLVKNLREDGFMILMDDFGSGYSSLNMLSTVEIDAIKLDALFLKINDKHQSASLRILESVINMAKQIGLAMIVEGVEDTEQVDFLINLGCRYAQGYYFYRPMPQEEFEAILKDKSKLDEFGFVIKANEQFRLREFLDENIYSDTMLNSIIGAVAIYSLREDRVDIVRYNEQFYNSVSSSEFSERLIGIEKYIPEEDRPSLFKTLEKAMKDKLNGADGTFRFYKEDGSITVFYIKFFYIGEKDGYPKFYGSAIKITDIVRLRDEYNIIASKSEKTIYFAEKNNEKWVFTVGCNGLKKYTKYEDKELEEVLNNIENAKYAEHAKTFIKLFSEFDTGKTITTKSVFHCKNGKTLNIKITCEPVKTYSQSVSYIVVVEKA